MSKADGSSPLVQSFEDLLLAAGAVDQEDLINAMNNVAELDADLDRNEFDIVVRVDNLGTVLPYPFSLDEFWEVLEELDSRAEAALADE